jgi:hypothetical protein
VVNESYVGDTFNGSDNTVQSAEKEVFSSNAIDDVVISELNCILFDKSIKNLFNAYLIFAQFDETFNEIFKVNLSLDDFQCVWFEINFKSSNFSVN